MGLIDADELESWIIETDPTWCEGGTRAILDHMGTMPTIEWIPCSERLPEDEYVLISKKPTKIAGDKWSVAIAIRMSDPRSRKIQWRDTGFGVIPDDNVLAWMPLPEPYQEGEGD